MQVLDGSDNCQITVNPTQADTDSDGAGDACDVDTDGDSVCIEGRRSLCGGCVGASCERGN